MARVVLHDAGSGQRMKWGFPTAVGLQCCPRPLRGRCGVSEQGVFLQSGALTAG